MRKRPFLRGFKVVDQNQVKLNALKKSVLSLVPLHNLEDIGNACVPPTTKQNVGRLLVDAYGENYELELLRIAGRPKNKKIVNAILEILERVEL